MRSVLYRRGRVRSSADPFATALLVRGGDVVWVGGEAAAGALGADAVVDLNDAWVAPAFVDAHVHATSTGLALTGLDLAGAASLAQALDMIARVGGRAAGGAVLGTGWDETAWPERRPPTTAELDRAGGGAFVYLARADVHSAVVSSALLAAVPQARGLPGFAPDGPLRQAAHHAVRRAAHAAVTPAQRRDAQRATRQRAAALGVGCLHECGGPDIGGEGDFGDLLALAAQEPGPDVVGYWGELDGVDRARALGASGAAGDLFVDGALGSHTAWLTEPYADQAGTGAAYLSAAEVARHVAACTRAGLQAGFHAIGDAALDAVCAGISQAAATIGLAPVRAARHRVEHAELLSPAHIRTLAEHGVVASVQPAFDARWGGPDAMYAQRLGADRARRMNPLAALAAAGVPLALGSDAPVTPLDPWGSWRAAVRHTTPGSGLSARASFSAHTRGGWRAARDDATGDLVPGAPATFAIWQVPGELVVQLPDERVTGWSTDPRAAVSGLPDLSGPDPVCLATVVRGHVVYDPAAVHPAVDGPSGGSWSAPSG